MCCCICWSCCCGEKETEEQKQKRAKLLKIAQLQVIRSSIPVFIAAGVNNFVSSLIESIAEESEHPIQSLILQSLAYTIIVFLLGKCVVYYVRKQQQQQATEDIKHISIYNPPSRENSISPFVGGPIPPPLPPPVVNADAVPVIHQSTIWQYITKYQLEEFLCSTVTENSGFAWKEFLVIYILEYFNEEYGYVGAWGMWSMWVCIFLFSLRLFNRFQKNHFHMNHHLSILLSHFDTEAYAFAIAYVFSVLLALGFQEDGVQYVNDESFLFEWKHHDDDDGSHEDSDFDFNSFKYYFVVSFIVSVILMFEEFYFKVSPDEQSHHQHHSEMHHHDSERPDRHSHSIKDSDAEDSRTVRESIFEHMLGIDPHEQSTLRNLWHNTLGYFLGLAWFLFITDFLMSCFNGSTKLASFLNALVVTVIITCSAPRRLAAAVMRSDTLKKKIGEGYDSEISDEPQTTSDLTKERTGCTTCILKAYNLVYYAYAQLTIHRGVAYLSAVRLAVGWSWETLTMKFFEVVTESSDLSKGQNILINFASAIVIIIIALIMHWSTLSWEAAKEEQQQEQQNPTPVTNQSLARETENPLTVHPQSMASFDGVGQCDQTV